MKYLGILFVMCLAVPAMAIGGDYGEPAEVVEAEEPAGAPYCPTTKISDNDKCMSCHAMVPDKDGKPVWGLKELRSDAGYWDMPSCLTIVWDSDGSKSLRMKITGTGGSNIRRAADYMYRHPEFKNLAVHLFTGGGSVMDAWEAVGIIGEMRERGIRVSTHCYGLAASAGVILLASGDIGHRYVNKHAEIMMHKVWNFAMFDISDPDTAEDKAATLKHFQNNINNWFVSRTNLTEHKIEELIYKRDYWMSGKEAVELGIADHMIN